MALTRVSGRVVYPHGEDTPTPVTGDGVIEYAHATPGVIGEAVHGPDRHRIEYVDGVAGEAWLKAGMWRAYVYPSEGRSYTLHLGIPDGGDVTLADVVGEVVPEGIVTKGEQGAPGASVTGGRDLGDGRVVFTLSGGKETEPVQLPPGPAGRGIVSISEADENSVVTITYTDDTTSTVKAIRGADGHSPAITWDGTVIVTDGTPGPDLKGEPGEPGAPGADSTVPGPPGPPGAVPTAADYLVVGPGRPDAPTTTGLSAAQIAALPVGCEYRSTDGASVGAWVWRKRNAGWVVTSGDTGWVDRTATVNGRSGGTFKVRRTESSVFAAFDDLQFESLTSGNPAVKLPSGFQVTGVTYLGAVLALSGGTVAGGSYARIDFIGWDTIRFPSATSALRLRDFMVLPPSTDPWPTTLTI